MSLAHLVGLSIALAVSLTLPAPLRAADAAGVVSGTGRAKVTRPPQVLRAQFVLTGEGKDVVAAVAKLKEAQAAARKKLAEIGAAEKSIEAGPTRTGPGPADARTQYTEYMQEMQRAAMQQAGMPGSAKAAAKPQIAIVSCTLKAEWALPAADGDHDELFVAASALQEKIKSTRIGKRDLKKLTPEELEAAEEALGSGTGTSAGGGEPSFQYVCKIPEADRAAARAEAFRLARQDAADTARAAGTELAALRQVTTAVASPTAAEGGESAFLQAMLQQMTAGAAQAAAAAGEPPTDEATALAPMPVTLQITVTASFDVK